MGFLKIGYLKIFNFIDKLEYMASQIFMISLCVFLVIALVLVIRGVIKNYQKKALQDAIYPTTLAVLISCILMIPLTLSLNKLVKNTIKKGYKEELSVTQAALEVVRAQKDKVKVENELEEFKREKNTEIASLQRQIDLLKASQVSVGNFKRIAEVALLKLDLKSQRVWAGPLTDMQKTFWTNKDYKDEYLIVNTYDMPLKFGIDLQELKIKKINNNKIQIVGLHPKFFGFGGPINKKTLFAEIREHYYKKDKYKKDQMAMYDIEVKTDADSKAYAAKIEEERDNEYQKSFDNMETGEFSYLSSEVVNLGKKFIEMMFAPVYSEIEFVEEDDGNFIKMEEYINGELAYYNQQLEEVLKPARNIFQQSQEALHAAGRAAELPPEVAPEIAPEQSAEPEQ